MRRLARYFPLICQKPALLWRGTWSACLSNIFGRDVLRGAELAVTYRCQAKCAKCSTLALQDPVRREISADEVVAIAGRIVDEGGLLVNLTGGEALLRPDILSIVERIARMPVFVSLATNAFLLSEKRLIDLRKAGLNMVQIGLNSPFSHEHDAELGLAGSFQKIVSAVEASRRVGIQVLFNVVVTRDVLHSDKLKMMVEMARQCHGYVSLILPASLGGWQGQDVNLNTADLGILKEWLRYPHVTMDTETCYRRGACPAGTEKIYINPYGDVYPCPFIHHKYGNILTDDLAGILAAMRKRRWHGCANCKD